MSYLVELSNRKGLYPDNSEKFTFGNTTIQCFIHGERKTTISYCRWKRITTQFKIQRKVEKFQDEIKVILVFFSNMKFINSINKSRTHTHKMTEHMNK